MARKKRESKKKCDAKVEPLVQEDEEDENYVDSTDVESSDSRTFT